MNCRRFIPFLGSRTTLKHQYQDGPARDELLEEACKEDFCVLHLSHTMGCSPRSPSPMLSWSVLSAGSNSSSWTIWDRKRSRPIGFRRSHPCINVKPATCPDTKPAGVRCRPPCNAPLLVAANDVFLLLLGQADGSNMRRLRMLAPTTPWRMVSAGLRLPTISRQPPTDAGW